VETARGLASQAALNALAVAAQAVGTLDRVRIVQMLVLVASTPELGEQSRVTTTARCTSPATRGKSAVVNAAVHQHPLHGEQLYQRHERGLAQISILSDVDN
jgi:hypothetical protein